MAAARLLRMVYVREDQICRALGTQTARRSQYCRPIGEALIGRLDDATTRGWLRDLGDLASVWYDTTENSRQRARKYDKTRYHGCNLHAMWYEDGAETYGWIAESPRGNRGFGYDPIFIGSDTFGATYAELDPIRKNTRSHRKQVMARLAHWLAMQVRP